MKRALIALSLLVAVGAFADGEPLNTTPYLHVRDVDLGTVFEVVDADTGFTQIQADTTIRAEWAMKSHFDSLNVGNPGAGAVRGVYSMASTADSSRSLNFFQDKGQADVNFVSAVFGNGASPEWGGYLTRYEDADFNLGTNSWVISCFAKGLSPGNPVAGKLQTVWSLFQTPDQISLHFKVGGYPVLLVTDDYGTTADSVVLAMDLYDSTWHYLVAERRGSNFKLRADNGTGAYTGTTAVDKAAGALDPDTLMVFAERAAGSPFRGMVDHLKIVEDSTLIGPEYQTYERVRSIKALDSTADEDTARVYITGVKTDSTWATARLSPPHAKMDSAVTRWHAFESAHLGSELAEAVIVYSVPTSPRKALLDSIPAGLLRSEVAQLFAGRRGMRLRSARFQHESNRDTTSWQLRLYPSIEDSRDLSDGFDLLATARLNQGYPQFSTTFGVDGLLLPPGSFITVYARGHSASVAQPKTTGSVVLEAERK